MRSCGFGYTKMGNGDYLTKKRRFELLPMLLVFC